MPCLKHTNCVCEVRGHRWHRRADQLMGTSVLTVKTESRIMRLGLATRSWLTEIHCGFHILDLCKFRQNVISASLACFNRKDFWITVESLKQVRCAYFVFPQWKECPSPLCWPCPALTSSCIHQSLCWSKKYLIRVFSYFAWYLAGFWILVTREWKSEKEIYLSQKNYQLYLGHIP